MNPTLIQELKGRDSDSADRTPRLEMIKINYKTDKTAGKPTDQNGELANPPCQSRHVSQRDGDCQCSERAESTIDWAVTIGLME